MRLTVLVLMVCVVVATGHEARADTGMVELAVEPVEYRLDIVVDYDAERVAGTCTVTVENTSDAPARHIPFLLYRLLAVSTVRDERGHIMRFAQAVTPLKGWEVIAVNAVTVTLPEPLRPGGRGTVTLDYEGRLEGYADDGWRYVKDHVDRDFTMMRQDGYGYPVVGIPDDTRMYRLANFRFDYAVNVTVPTGLVVATGGALTAREETGGVVRYAFRSVKPSWRMDIAIADYARLEKGANTVVHFTRDAVTAGHVMAALDYAVTVFSDWFGPLDGYRGFTILEVPDGYSGQADVAAVILPAGSFTDPASLAIVYHEMSHMWNVPSLDVRPCRLESEGLAQFLQELLREERGDATNAVADAVTRHRERFRTAAEKHPDYLSVPMCDYGEKDMIDYSYSNGMVFFALLYRLCGPETVNHAIRTFIGRYAATGAGLGDFTRHVAAECGLPEAFMRDWVYTPTAAGLICGTLSLDEIAARYR